MEDIAGGRSEPLVHCSVVFTNVIIKLRAFECWSKCQSSGIWLLIYWYINTNVSEEQFISIFMVLQEVFLAS